MASNLDDLTPDEVVSLASLWQQLRDIDNRPWNSFKQSAIHELSGHIATYINTAPNGDVGAAVRTLREQGFRTCLQGMYGSRLRDLKQSVEQLQSSAIESATATAEQKATKVTRNGDGTVNIPLSESLVEILWFLGPVEPWLNAAAGTWAAELKKIPLDQRQAWIERRLVESLHDYSYAQRRAAKLQLFLDQPHRVRQLIASVTGSDLQTERIRDLLARFNGSRELENVVSSIEPTASERELAQMQLRMDEARRRINSTRVALAVDLEKNSAALKSFFENQAATLQRLQLYYTALYSKRHINFPANRRPDDPAPFLRLHVTPPEGRDCRGLRSEVTVRVSVCRWIGDKTTVTAVADADTAVTFDKQLGPENAPEAAGPLLPVEDIPLGISITQVLFRADGSLQLPGGIIPTVAVDQQVLRDALRRMGLPEQVTMGRVSVEVSSLTRYVLRANVTPPEVGFLPDSNATTNSVPVVIPIDVENLGTRAIEELLGSIVDKLQRDAEEQVRNALNGPANSGNLRFTSIEPLGQWRNGTIAYSVGLRVGRIGQWSIPEDAGSWSVRAWCRKQGDQWRITLAPAGPPAALLSLLQARVVDSIKAASLDTRRLGEHVSELAKYLRLENPRYNTEQHTLTATLVCGTELLPTDSPITIPQKTEFTVNLKTGQFDLAVFRDFNTQLKAASQLMLAEFLKRINGELSERAAELLKGKELKFFGTTLTVNDARHDKGRIRLDVKGELLGKPIAATEVLLVGGKVSENGVETPRFDFRETVLTPGFAKLVSDVLDLSDSILRVGSVVSLPDAISIPVSIHIEELGGDVSLGNVTLGKDANTFGDLKKNLPEVVQQFIAKQLGNKLVIADLGPISELTLSKKSRFLRELEIWVDGKAEVPGLSGTYIPFSARIVPGPPVIEVDEKAAGAAAMIALKHLLPENFLAGSPIENVQPIDTKPYGVSFDLKLKAWVFTVAAKGIRLTTRGMELPASIAVQPPGMIPVPTAFAIVDPGVVVPLKRDGEIGIVGDVTLGSKGIDKIVKLRSVLSTSTRHPGTFKLDGTLILVDMLPLLKVDGSAAFDTGVLDLNAQTVGLVDKIIQVRDRTHVEAAKGLFEQNGSLGILGIRLTQTNIRIEAFRPAITANAKVTIPLVTTELGITASPRLSDFHAHAAFDVSLGSFTLTSGILDVDSTLVDFRFHVVLFDVRVIAPSLTTLTPDRVLHAILSLFDFDISAFFDAIINRKITISFFDESGKPTNGSVGQGNPPPPDSRGNPGDAFPPGPDSPSPSDSVAEPSGNGQSPPPGTNLPPHDPNRGQPNSTTRGNTPTRNEPVERLVHTVRMRKKGDTTYEIVQDPDGSELFVEKYTWQGQTYYGWMLFAKDVRDHLLEERIQDGGRVMVLSWLWRPVTDAERGAVRSRTQQSVEWVSAYLTINAKNQIHVCERFPAGKVKLVELPFDQIGPRLGARTPEETYELFRNDAESADSKFTDGDTAVLGDFARVQFVPNFGSTKFYKRLPAVNTGLKLGQSDLKRPEGYLYELADEHALTQLIFQPREGRPLVLDRTESEDSLYEHLSLSNPDALEQSPRTANVISLLAHTSANGIPAGYVFGGRSGPLVFLMDASKENPRREMWTLKDSGEFSPPLWLVDEGLKHDARSSLYFGERDGTTAFARALAAR